MYSAISSITRDLVAPVETSVVKNRGPFDVVIYFNYRHSTKRRILTLSFDDIEHIDKLSSFRRYEDIYDRGCIACINYPVTRKYDTVYHLLLHRSIS